MMGRRVLGVSATVTILATVAVLARVEALLALVDACLEDRIVRRHHAPPMLQRRACSANKLEVGGMKCRLGGRARMVARTFAAVAPMGDSP
mgnify:CR=1 FL=1